MGIEKWDARFAAGDHGPADPSAIVVEVSQRLSPGRALDLACGAGRNAAYLASQGWSVVAVDGSVEALRLTKARASVLLMNLERDRLPFDDETFDLVCIIHFLHRPLFTEARRVTRRGGVIVASIETTRSKMNRAYTIEPGELRSIFGGWEILIDREDETARVAAKKPY